jgi:membrane peptidoglycan carboxypeptidase
VASRQPSRQRQDELAARYRATAGSGRPVPGAPPSPTTFFTVGKPAKKGRFIDYPRAGRSGWTRFVPSWRFVLGSFTFLVLAAFGGLFAAYAATPSQPANADALAQTSVAAYADGSPIGQFKQEQRTLVKLAQVPDPVQKAVLSAEDRTFYQNNGVSPTGIMRAAWSNFRGGSTTQGGSTITQQYVKNFFLSNERSWQRKVKELFISVKIDREVPKDKILQDYLNRIYFGRNAYGIQAASQAWFGKDVGKLTPSQGAFLAGIINGPELYDPKAGGTEAATERWRYVLDGMVTEKWMTQTDETKILAEGLPKPIVKKTVVDLTHQRSYLMDMIAKEFIAKTGLSREDLDTKGYFIRTTFQPALIDQGIAAIDKVLGPRKTWPTGTEVGMSTVDPTTGAVLAIYGGDGTSSWNAATQAPVIAGSTFKPFGLIAALKGVESEGIAPLSLRSRYSGHSPYILGSGEKVQNFDNEQAGMVDLPTATAESLNTVYVQLNERMHPKATLEAAVAAGVPRGTRGLETNMTNILGTSSPHVIDMAGAYATIANQGVRNPTFFIRSVTQRRNNALVFSYTPKGARVFSKEVMADTTYAMQQVIKRGTGTYARQLGRPAAGKTGTSSDFKSAWFVGFTPQLSTAVALYRTTPEGGIASLDGWGRYKGQNLSGPTFPVRLWTEYMSTLLDGKPELQFPPPAYGGDTENPAPPPSSAAPSPSDTPSPTATDGGGQGGGQGGGGQSGGGGGGQPSPTDQPSSQPPTPGPPTPTGGGGGASPIPPATG